jgi:serine/threonine protein phosphatase 1
MAAQTSETALVWNVLRSQAARTAPRTPSRTRIYAVGDVHGRDDVLVALFARIDEDLKAQPAAKSIEIFIGDYIDRGPHSREVLDRLIARRRDHNMVFLKGNHEECALSVLGESGRLAEWKQMGGMSTLLSYGVVPPRSDDGSQAQHEIASAFRDALPDDHYRFLQSLALSFSCGDFFFAHAGVRPGIPLSQQSERDLLWIRDDFLLHEEDFGKVVVHGHTPTREPEVRPNRINIDTGAYATGRLTCIVLEADQMRFLL